MAPAKAFEMTVAANPSCSIRKENGPDASGCSYPESQCNTRTSGNSPLTAVAARRGNRVSREATLQVVPRKVMTASRFTRPKLISRGSIENPVPIAFSKASFRVHRPKKVSPARCPAVDRKLSNSAGDITCLAIPAKSSSLCSISMSTPISRPRVTAKRPYCPE